MSSGYVTTNLPRRVDRTKSPLRRGVSVDLTALGVNPASAKFSTNDYAWRNPITSFRSGPSYEREVRKPGAILSNQNLNELLASEAGDMGHEFYMGKVTDYYGDTFAKRPDVSCSPLWNQVTNPIPMCFSVTNAGTSCLNTIHVDDSYGFVKSDSALVTLGTSFIASTSPIQSQVNLLSDIAEAFTSGFLIPELIGKSIISSIINPTSRSSIIRAIGGEYLNIIFGYKPLAEDIAKVGVLIDTVNGIVNQWIKDNGTIVRRRREIPGIPYTLGDRSLNNSGSGMAAFTLNPAVPSGSLHLPSPFWPGLAWESTANRQKMICQGFMVQRLSSQISFSAGYEYDLTRMFLPFGSDKSAAEILHSAALRGELSTVAFGLDPSSVSRAIFDATPFSWLLDWFVNVGDVVNNFRNLISKGVQMLWGYVTETTIRDSYFEYALTWAPTGQQFLRSNGVAVQKAIKRIRATPFGFGTSFGSLSATQGSILASLAASKAR